MELSSKTSSDETDRSDGSIAVTARSYGCVFCKRGFTTAQALGGHMNIHRKDRAKTRPSVLPNPIFDESYGSLRLSYNYNYINPSSAGYPVFLPSWDIARVSYNSHEVRSVRSEPFNNRDYWRQTQILQSGPSDIGEMRVAAVEDIDLELRLGYI